MTNKKIRKFALLPSYCEVALTLPDDKRAKFLEAICLYGWLGDIPDFQDPVMMALFKAVQPAIDNSVEYFEKKKAAGQHGGLAKARNNLAKPSKDLAKPSTKVAKLSKDVAKASKDLAKPSVISNKYKVKVISKSNNNNSMSKSQSDIDPPTNLFGEKIEKVDLTQECKFYIWAFNRLTKRHYRWTEDKQTLFERQRNKFSLEDLVTSSYSMNNDEFYLGKNDRNWIATPTWHLGKPEHIMRFLEQEDEPEFRELAKEAIKTKWSLFLKGENS